MSGPERQKAARIEVKDLVVRYAGDVVAVNGVSFTVGHGEHVTLLGPSGCGKTTTLRAIAGLEQPEGGFIGIEGDAMYSAAERINVPAEHRGVSMVFQSYAIWPHMTVFENVAYRLACPQARQWRDQGGRRPGPRVRSRCATSPTEPPPSSPAASSNGLHWRARSSSRRGAAVRRAASNLDAKLRAEMRLELRELQRELGITSVYVTHDQEEALAISDRVIVMNVGASSRSARPRTSTTARRNRFVAEFVGWRT